MCFFETIEDYGLGVDPHAGRKPSSNLASVFFASTLNLAANSVHDRHGV